MALTLFNTLGRKPMEFKPIKPGQVGLYTCGPTVYWYAHVGNLRTYVNEDILRRVLEYDGFKVKHVMNITDVGHLTSDADDGEDKVEETAKKEGKTAQEITKHYTDTFIKDLKSLNILEPTIWCKATEHIKEQIELIQMLEKNGFTYKTSDGVYFDTSKDGHYGELALLQKDNLMGGKRIDLKEKRNKTDFALWKFSQEKAKRQQEWQSPWGVGFPGWHIECSAMSMKYLGNHFDIHAGGEDHVPIHHTNEIAQAECATHEKFVNYWVHGAFLKLGDDRMGKSKGNIKTIPELDKDGYEPMVFRYFCLTAHYRKPLTFSMQALDGAKNSLEKLRGAVANIKGSLVKSTSKYMDEFVAAINSDLNMPQALSILWSMLGDQKLDNGEKYALTLDFDKVLGLQLDKIEQERFVEDIPPDVKKLLDQRQIARKKKDWLTADKLRDDISSLGFEIIDTPRGPQLK